MIELRNSPTVVRERSPAPSQPPDSVQAALEELHRSFWVRGDGTLADEGSPEEGDAFCPALPLRRLGDASFINDLGLRFAYVAGAMANGIASVEMVEALCLLGLLGIFGAAGLTVESVENALDRLQGALGGRTFGANLIHSPNEPRHEAAVADLYLRRKVRLVEASAYLDLTLPIVKYRLAGLQVGPDGAVVAPNHVIAKVSRSEVAAKFMSPAPAAMLRQLVAEDFLTPQQAEWARLVPLAQDITAEADSAGHTDNRPALTLLPTLSALRDRIQAKHEYDRPLRIGAAGGIATPAAAAAAFALGAAYVVTGTVNQACRESGTSDLVRQMLAQTEQADVCMAPAADMFEMGVKVQVLKRGTLFPMRAARLHELYRQYDSLDALPNAERANLERSLFRAPLDLVWEETKQFFARRDPRQIELAEADPKHKMALVFRSYLGQSSRWANQGDASRQTDFQVWCGPAMGAFNEWTRNSFLGAPAERRVGVVALNLLYGAALQTRANSLKLQRVQLARGIPDLRPRRLAELQELLSAEAHA